MRTGKAAAAGGRSVKVAPGNGRLIARQNDTAIGSGSTVTLHFSILLADGQEVDTTRRNRPATFRVGDGNLPSAFERALFGLRAGADERLWIPPDEGFGPRRIENIRTLRRADFPNAASLESGTMVLFEAVGGELPGVVTAVDGDLVEVDFNHPLAGRKLAFDVTILRVEN